MSDTISTANMRNWLEMFCVAKAASGRSQRTLRWYRERIGVYLTWLDAHDGYSPTDPIALEIFLAEQRQINSAHTIQGHFRAFSSLLNWLVKRRYIAVTDAATKVVEKPKLPRKRMKYVTKEEFDRIYASIRGTKWTDWRDRALLILLYFSGLRAGELLNLRLTDIERSERIIYVRDGKGSKDRVVPYAPQLDEVLDLYLKLRPPHEDNGFLILASDGYNGVRGVMVYDGLKEVMRRRSRAAGMPRMKLHAFRHGFAMIMLNNGMDMSAVSKAMGHSSITLTASTYAHWVTDGLKNEYNSAFSRIMGDESVRT